VPKKREENVGGVSLLLDPAGALRDREEEVVSGGRRRIDGEQPGEAVPLVGLERAAAIGDPFIGREVHADRLEARAEAAGEVAPDEDTGPVEVAGDADGRGAGDQLEQRDHGVAGLAAAEHDELAGPGPHLDVVEERGLVLDDGGARDRGVQRGAAELAQSQRGDVALAGVAVDVIEPLAALGVDQRPEAVDGERRLVAEDTAALEGQAGGHVVAAITQPGQHVVAGRRVELDQGQSDRAGQLAPGLERLAVAEETGREGGAADRRQVGQSGLDPPDHLGGARRGGVGPARAGVGEDRAPPVRERSARIVQVRPGYRRRRRESGQAGGESGAQGALLAAWIGGVAAERAIEEDVEGSAVLGAGARVRGGEVEAHLSGSGRADGAGGEEGGERGRARGRRLDREPVGQLAGAVAPVEDGRQAEVQARRLGDERADAGGGVHAGQATTQDLDAALRAWLGPDRDAAFAAGAAPALARAVERRVAGVLTAERFPHYLTVLFGLALFRRDHEIEPLHDHLLRRVLPAQLVHGDYGPLQFASDMEQLVEWGAVERTTEALKLRTYRDNRRDRFRYRLGDDAAALLEWLEARASARVEGRVRDGRDLLADVLGFLGEARRLCDRYRADEAGPDDPRRVFALLEAVADAIDAIARELGSFRAEMIAFAARPYDLATLRQILDWLGRYVDLYLDRVEALRADLEERIAALAAPRYRVALAGCRAAVVAERSAMPSLARGAGPLPETEFLIDRAARFFRSGGQLAELRRHIAVAARAVLRKMHRHLIELERRSARRADLRAAITALFGVERAVDTGALASGLVAAAHLRTVRDRTGVADRIAPPAPRRHQGDPARRSAPRPLRRKRAALDDVRVLRGKRLAELGRWIDGELLGGADEVLLSARALPVADVRRWMEVSRARHLGGGRELARLPASFEPAPGMALVGDAGEGEGLLAPDCSIRRKP
jgi:Protein of unknown function (DUF2397)